MNFSTSSKYTEDSYRIDLSGPPCIDFLTKLIFRHEIHLLLVRKLIILANLENVSFSLILLRTVRTKRIVKCRKSELTKEEN